MVAIWTVILLAGRMSIPHEIMDAAKVDGATGLRSFIHVTFPLLANLYLVLTLLATIFFWATSIRSPSSPVEGRPIRRMCWRRWGYAMPMTWATRNLAWQRSCRRAADDPAGDRADAEVAHHGGATVSVTTADTALIPARPLARRRRAAQRRRYVATVARICALPFCSSGRSPRSTTW